ncbi:hypothetical protein [Syntrophomonas palmitatica]|uniref:hypothetical protein n=1 Tax=Syntrophomonas palmitatica TaxID=402877 RepID=UPI0006D1C0FD|nr:hypothetical protein [Syntrophomonas palmitatica]
MANTRQIAKYQTNKYLLEILDNLQIAEPENASNIHGKFSKIKLLALDYSQGTGDKTVTADINLNPATAKYLAEIILNGTLQQTALIKSEVKFNALSEQKILSHKLDDQDMARVTIFSVDFDGTRRYCWQVTVENGIGKPQKQSTGGISLQKGSYIKQKQVNVFMSDMDFKKLLITTRDYIQAWEIVHLRGLLEKRGVYEEATTTAAS